MLSRIRKSTADKDQGFTLIELLVVIIIIGILAAIAIPVFLNQRKKGVDAGIKADLKNAATATETYITDNPTATWAANALILAPATPGFKLTTGNVMPAIKEVGALGVAGTGGGYCIQITNPNGTDGAVGFVYNSAKGGLQPAASACP